MSNVDIDPPEVDCRPDAPCSGIQVLSPREVPLGGPRALEVRRTIPHRERSFIGAWCFLDHYGPADLSSGPGMDVPPHPHTGLQTVSWLFSGVIEHRDSHGVHALVRPGELNLMSAGRGICHSEVSTPDTETLHGVQLWVVLPQGAAEGERDFQHHVAPEIAIDAEHGLESGGGSAKVFLGSLLGETSPVATATELLGAELRLAPGTVLRLTVEAGHEHGVLVDAGSVTMDGAALECGDLGCRDAGAAELELRAGPGGARLVLLGGEPFEEEIIMWWNFVGRSHEEIVAFREQWQDHDARYGEVEGYAGTPARLPAPELPGVRLRGRTRHGRLD